MTYGYLLTKNSRIQQYNYQEFLPKKKFDLNFGKIATLLILSERVSEITFDINDKSFYEEMVKISYTDVTLKIKEMKKGSSEILKEQSIIAGVSNWDGYFQGISEIILNDDKFIQKMSDNEENKESFREFLKSFNLMQDFSTEVMLNGNKMKGLRFGTYIKTGGKNKENAKPKNNYFQIVKNVDTFLKLCDIKIKDIDKANWPEIPSFINDRHQIIHDPNNNKISDYPKNKIEHILKNMSNLIATIDKTLFSFDQDSLFNF